MLISHKGHTDTIQVYSVTVMTHVKTLQAGHSSQGTSEPITPTVHTVPIVTGQPVSKSPAFTQETRNPLRAAQLSPGTDTKSQNGAHEVYIGGVSKDNTSDDVVTFLKAEHIHNIHSAQSLGKKGE